MTEHKGFTKEEIDLARKTTCKDLNDEMMELFMFKCQRYGAHILDGQLYPTVRKDKNGKQTLAVIVGIDFMRTAAAKTGEHIGTSLPEFTGTKGKNDYTVKMKVERLVQGQKAEFWSTVDWVEYYPGKNFMWDSKGNTMISKVVESHCLRKGFPVELAGLYTHEEFEQQEPNPYTAAMFQDMPPDTWLSGILLGIDEPIKKGAPETARFQLDNEMLITCDIQFCEEAWRGLEGQEVELMVAKKPKGVLVLVEMREKANGHDHIQATVGVTPVRTEQRKPTPKLKAVIQPHEINMETGDDVPHEQYTHPDDKADPQDWFEPGVLVRGFVTKIATKTGTSAKGPWEKTTFTIDPATGEELVVSTFALAKHFDLMSYDEVDKQAVWFMAVEGREFPKNSGRFPLELDDILLEPIRQEA